MFEWSQILGGGCVGFAAGVLFVLLVTGGGLGASDRQRLVLLLRRLSATRDLAELLDLRVQAIGEFSEADMVVINDLYEKRRGDFLYGEGE